MEKELHILYQSSNTYVIPTGISLYSMYKNNQGVRDLYVHMISDGIEKENRDTLTAIAASFKRSIDWIEGGAIADMLEEHHIHKYAGSYTTYMKLFVPNQISERWPNAERLFYIDSDTLVVGSLAGILDFDLTGMDLAAVDEYVLESSRKNLKVKTNTFNAGVLLFNLVEWKNHSVEDKILRLLQDEEYISGLRIADQGILNTLLENTTLRLPVEYNYTTWFYLYRDRDYFVKKLRIWPDFYSQDEIDRAAKAPIVVHYLDIWNGRPWDHPNANPFTDLYERYKAECFPGEEFLTVQRHGIRRAAKLTMIWLFKHLPPDVMSVFHLYFLKAIYKTGLR